MGPLITVSCAVFSSAHSKGNNAIIKPNNFFDLTQRAKLWDADQVKFYANVLFEIGPAIIPSDIHNRNVSFDMNL